jgi:hypothetical protein
MPGCGAPIADDILLDYWVRDVTGSDETDPIEEHLYACGDCSARLHRIASLGTGLAALVRLGRVTGIMSRSLLNRLQRDGVHVRLYSLSPGEIVPCAVFPGDDLVVTALRADFSAADAVTLSVMEPGGSSIGRADDVPVSRLDGEVLWALPAAIVRQMPSMRLQITLVSAGDTHTELGTYALDHSASPA